ncbi:zinc-dependent alcohol dehydrogenase [Halalkalibacter alkaliphilus]|uniref:Alcohol dehydrogenase catalytic domain-containing protein n=1 Tax=Halalkalibacter alkaliphilus TaxID=2917993 RepID=A0A9X2CP47_9BACI|nr:alcohol dehydrogenase catalytic domain-containing protein [Halalkalibacter alkaliphilus]MCL7745767.1 alcohol dehydrogenase catalytic domain-containing protein [Halalkalibacter alkaliphilus]
MSKFMTAAVYNGPKQIDVQQVRYPEPPEGCSLIKVAYCGICGTDLNIYGGGHPRAHAPLIMGHEFSGLVYGHPSIEDGKSVTVLPLLYCGDCKPCNEGFSHICETLNLIGIDCDGGMAQFVAVPNEKVIPLPDSMSLKAGALIEPFAVAVHAIRESKFKPGDSTTVFGAGPIGLCVALVLRCFGAKEITVVEPNSYRKNISTELGFHTLDPVKDDIPKNDLVYDCAAHPTVAEKLVEKTHVRGEIVLVGAYKKPTPLDLQNITFKELSIKGTRVYTDIDYEIAMKLINEHPDCEKIITHVVDIKNSSQLLKELSEGANIVKAVVSFNLEN